MNHVRDMPSLNFAVIRDLRKAREMTLEQVSEKSGVSIAVLSRLERNQHVCEIDTLYRLARIFGLSASDLLSLSESTSAHRKNTENYKSGDFLFERIQYEGIECFFVRAEKDAELTRPEAHGDDYEICWMRKGSIRLKLPKEQYLLKTGDVLKFDAVLPHTYDVIEDTEMFIVHLKKKHRF